jgi:precorrin-3B C17-methyltransferase
VLAAVETVAGYTTYVELVRPLIQGKRIVASAMTKEVGRVETAIELARSGQTIALISSGDPGIYAMAGLVLEVCARKGIAISPPSAHGGSCDSPDPLLIEVVPGIPALCSGAALLGAPLTHDFAAISLSDLLTPWQVIERRLEAAAMADFVIVLYNPKSKRRSQNLEKAQQILLRHRSGQTPVGIVVSAMRAEQHVEVIPLAQLHSATVNMQTTLFVGSSASQTYGEFMFTPRGYAGKYKLD